MIGLGQCEPFVAPWHDCEFQSNGKNAIYSKVPSCQTPYGWAIAAGGAEALA